MERRKIKWNFRIYTGVSLLIALLIQYTGGFISMNKQAASIGIIGGADGPTTIFITEKIVDKLLLENFYGIFVFIILLLIYKPAKLLIKKKK